MNKINLQFVASWNTIKLFKNATRKNGGIKMQAIITEQQQTALIKKQALSRLTRYKLAEHLNLSRSTVKDVLDKQAPFVVSGKTFTAVNNYLLEDL